MTADASASDLYGQITALTEIVGALATTVPQLNTRVDSLTRANRPSGQGDRADGHDEEQDNHDPAVWVWFTPPAAAEDEPDADDDPRITVDNFVSWYNVTYVGVEGSREYAVSAPTESGLSLVVEHVVPGLLVLVVVLAT